MREYKVNGVCSRKVSFSITGGKIEKVIFEGGCNGNTSGVSRLLEGMNVDEAIVKLKGITCGTKNTSCPDQLALALEKELERSREKTADGEHK